MKYYKLLIFIFTITFVTSCNSDDSGDDKNKGAEISNVRFTPRYFNSNSDLLIEWDSTEPNDITRIVINGTNYDNQFDVSYNSTAIELPINNYNFYLKNSKGTEFGPFTYTYIPMVYELNSEFDIFNETNTIKWKFDYYSSLSANNFQVEYGTQGFSIGSGTRKNIFNTSDMIDSGSGELLITDNINQGGTYDFYVRSVFNGFGESEWSGPYEIEFEDNYLNCETPIIESQNFSGGELSLSWNDSGVAYQFSFFSSSTTNPSDGSIQSSINLGTSITYYVGGIYGYYAIRSQCLDGSYTPWSDAYYYSN